VDRLTRLRIAAHARLAVRLHRTSDVGDDELARSALALLYRQLEQLIEERRCDFLPRADLPSQMRDNLGLAHWLSHGAWVLFYR